jgi:hypothetical protein
MSTNNSISEGDSFTCPYCQAGSFAKSRTEYEGFSVKRVYLVCAFCQAEISGNGKGDKTAKSPAKSTGSNKLSSLFGQSQATDKPGMAELLSDDNERRFCKNCRHNFITPFKCHCNLHQKEVEPLHDCPDFEPKTKITKL